eukprot:CAMPEP_0174954134 /NCGR_PEP_ID=MMETSP0004_2-20121128/257_1 /TAXON_ID=420556 /ORGANISM="Ochromonas sp., Strain CCMP1393" /LENGTH=217 /DNA_ID=CAMNT_0016201917 /DNA_START=268 /DNA_END=921 /DNA_ORIENTATION=-
MAKDRICICDEFTDESNNITHGRVKNAAFFANDFVRNKVTHNMQILHDYLRNTSCSEVVVAAEALDHPNAGPAMDWLLTAQPRVRVVVTRRAIPEWLRSGARSAKKPMSEFIDGIEHSYWPTLNPYHVEWRYQSFGISVVAYNFLDMEFLFCSIFQRPNHLCDMVLSGSYIVPHANGHLYENEENCIRPQQINKLEKYLAEYQVPMGQNWTSVTCQH